MSAWANQCERGAGIVLVLAAVLLGFMPRPGRAAEAFEAGYARMAISLYHFIDLTQWPAKALGDPGGPFVLGILGSDPWEGKLGLAYREAGRGMIKNRALVVTNCVGVADARKCHLVFISRSEKNRLAQILEELKGMNVLTVLDADRPSETDAVIVMYVKDRLRFMINETAVKRAQLTMDSNLKGAADKRFH